MGGGLTLSPKHSFMRVCLGPFPQLAPPDRWMTGGGAAVWGRWMETKYHVPGRGGERNKAQAILPGHPHPRESPEV